MKYIKNAQGNNAGIILRILFDINSMKSEHLIDDFEIRYPEILKNIITAIPPRLSKPGIEGSGMPDRAKW